ncbi:MAG: protein kinase [Desulfatitalea sp.]|nr:protein kinase [Desulfatitalea sp.]NNK01515.1 protein kinase [Desulfatitalea sp.]
MTEKIILLINRDAAFLDQTGSTLEDAGYHTRTASEMRGALALLSANAVGLIICDKALQDVSGFDLLNFIKKDPLREKIPFMFLVPANEQGGAFKAFELGAADYLVYPLAPQILVDAVDELFATDDDVPLPSGIPEAHPTAAANGQTSPTDDPIPVSGLIIDVSRDGVLWLPGNVQSFSRQSLYIETALFGKQGVSLLARIKRADGTFVLNGYIKEIRFEDFQKPAIIEMSVQEEEAWRRIHDDLTQKTQHQTQEAADQPEVEPQLEKTIVMSPTGIDKTAYKTGPFKPSKKKDPSYDRRFYHSLIGRQLDNYRAITLIGTGSMGGVIQGWDVALEREVALKVISYGLSSKESFREMFIKEARVVSRLNHLNVAQIYYIGTSSDILYYAMEFVDGLTMKELIAEQGNLNNLKGLEYFITVCEALYFVNQNSVIHRDIKPANIMITRAGNIKIVDFGVAVSADTVKKTTNNQIIGSPMYMSPEQVAGLSLDNRSDIYSVGATFYHAFTGQPPFQGTDFKTIMAHHVQTPLPPIRKKNANVPAALARIIEKMMAKDPLERYKDFQYVANDVKALRAHIVDRKRPSSRQTKTSG